MRGSTHGQRARASIALGVLALVAFALGLLALFAFAVAYFYLAWTGVWYLPAAGIGLVAAGFGWTARKRLAVGASGRRLATAGMVLGAITLVMFCLVVVDGVIESMVDDVDATAQCLEDAGGATTTSTNDDDLDPIAAEAPGGAVRAEVGETEVHVVFGRTADDPDAIKRGYDALDPPEVTKKGNAVIAWTHDPRDEDREAVASCLPAE